MGNAEDADVPSLSGHAVAVLARWLPLLLIALEEMLEYFGLVNPGQIPDTVQF